MPVPDTSIPILLEKLEIPDSAYEKAERRYKDLGDWLCREESEVARYSPRVFAQGSFLLGTVIRPLGDAEEFDLDLGCTLRKGIAKSSHTQQQIKEMLRRELELYRQANRISENLDEKKRCWRLIYKDEVRFHMDIVPAIPEVSSRAGLLKEAMITRGESSALAEEVAVRTLAITDNERDDYRKISEEWPLSNPEGYARWFESRAALAPSVNDRLVLEKRAEVEPIRSSRRKAPLQRVVQLLKLHRSFMYRDPQHQKLQPISVIITTLAARAYNGEEDVARALAGVLERMEGFVSPTRPRVANPVNPADDFADKWYSSEGLALDLEGNFRRWVREARRHFGFLAEAHDAAGLEKLAQETLGLKLDRRMLDERLRERQIAAPAIHVRTQEIQAPPKQWRRG